jgi:hypothetical protein
MKHVKLLRSAVCLLAISAVSFVVTQTLFATPTCPPPPAGASGCRCADAGCEQGTPDICLTGWCGSNSACWTFGETTGYWFKEEATDPKECINEGPLEGGGCDPSSTQAVCVIKYFCDCDWNFHCQNEVNQNQYYYPCVELCGG